MKIIQYPDGGSYAQVEDDLTKLQQKEGYAFTYKINSYQDLWQLGQILEIMNWKGCKPIVTIPNLIDAQADRRFNTNESFGLKMVLNFLNQFDALYRVFHPHNQDIVELLLDDVIIDSNYEFINQVLGKLDEDLLNENTILMSADAGGFKPLMKLCDELKWKGETAMAGKSRNYSEGKSNLIQTLDRQDFKGKDILIIDDISVYGGTFKGLSTKLKAANCGKLYLAISHMTVQNLGENPVTDYFDKVFTTNSKYDNYTYMSRTKNLEVIPTTYSPKNLEIIKIF